MTIILNFIFWNEFLLIFLEIFFVSFSCWRSSHVQVWVPSQMAWYFPLGFPHTWLTPSPSSHCWFLVPKEAKQQDVRLSIIFSLPFPDTSLIQRSEKSQFYFIVPQEKNSSGPFVWLWVYWSKLGSLFVSMVLCALEISLGCLFVQLLRSFQSLEHFCPQAFLGTISCFHTASWLCFGGICTQPRCDEGNSSTTGRHFVASGFNV